MSEYLWLLPACCIISLAFWCNAILGTQVLKRGVIFIDLAMAQIAVLGIIAIEILLPQWGSNIWVKLLIAWVITFLAAGVFYLLEKNIQRHLEAFVGISYVIAACISMILLSQYAHHGKDIVKELNNGRVLWSTVADLYPVIFVSAALWLITTVKPTWLIGHHFYFIFALVIPPLVINIGIYLEFASLIVPALMMHYLSTSRRYFYLIGLWLSAGLIGGYLSITMDWPIGSTLVLSLCLNAFLLLGFHSFIQKKQAKQVL